jgi:hypothetical protein
MSNPDMEGTIMNIAGAYSHAASSVASASFAERGLDPLAVQRPHLELYIRWMQEIRRFRSSTVSRRFSVTAGFYRTCVLDGVLPHSPVEHVRPGIGEPVRLRAGGRAPAARLADLRSHQRRHR